MSLPAAAAISEPLDSLRYKSVDYKITNGFYTNEALAPYDDIKRFNNFYEFGSDKSDPEKYAQGLTIDPWSLTIEGEVEKPGVYPLEDILKVFDIEERTYRLRCGEAWSMVIP
jgi:sulfoxide reductase catalytic subunit YedY